MTYDFAHWTFYMLFQLPVRAFDAHLADRDHFQDGLALEAVGAFLAADRVSHVEQRQRAFNADAFRRNFNVIVCIFRASLIVGRVSPFSAAMARRVGEPCRGVRHRGLVVGWVAGFMDRFLEADVIVVRCVSVRKFISLG